MGNGRETRGFAAVEDPRPYFGAMPAAAAKI